MVWIVLSVGYVITAVCLAILVAPGILRKILSFFSLGSRLYLAGSLRLVLGVMLLALATQARLWGYVVGIGLLLAASGLCVFFFALRRTKKLLARLEQQSNLVLRLGALFGIAIWVVLIYSLLP